MRLKPFFGYFGGKYRAAPRYPAPTHRTLVEPFAGAAGYALRYPDRRVILVERDPVVASAWRYLINSSSEDILSLPLLGDAGASVDDFRLSEPARNLIMLNLSAGDPKPRGTVSKFGCDWRPPWRHKSYRDPKTGWKRVAKPGEPWEWHEGYENFWGEKRRARIASQVQHIKHWKIIEGDYTNAPDVRATWFVDPPYQVAGKSYVFGSRDVDFSRLSGWCHRRKGQLIVCEAEGADWLPFERFAKTKSTPGARRKGKSAEVIYYRE